MTRHIQFNSPNIYYQVNEGGIAVYSKTEARFRNLFSYLNICSPVVKYKSGDKKLFISVKGFNKNLKENRIGPINRNSSQKAIAEKIALSVYISRINRLGSLAKQTAPLFYRCDSQFTAYFENVLNDLPPANYYFIFLIPKSNHFDFNEDAFQKFLNERRDVFLPTIIVVLTKGKREIKLDKLALEILAKGKKWIHLRVKSEEEGIDVNEERNAKAILSLKS